MYHGEVNVAQEDLNNFLQVAEELKVKGLTQNGSEQEKRSSSNEVKHRAPSQPIKPPPPMKMAPRVAAPVVPSIQDTEDDIQEVEAEVKTEPGASGVMEQYQGAHEMAGAATYEEGYEYGDFGEQESYVMDTADQEKGEREQNTLGMMRFNCIMPWESVYFCCSGIIFVKWDWYLLLEGFVSEELIFVTPSGRAECRVCEKDFSSKGVAKRHIISVHHNAHMNLQCKLCPAVLKNKNSLGSHMRKTHGGVRHLDDGGAFMWRAASALKPYKNKAKVSSHIYCSVHIAMLCLNIKT